jgi:hypothetical protein
MKKEAINRFKKQAEDLGYSKLSSHDGYFYTFKDNWEIQLKVIEVSANIDVYTIEAELHRLSTRHIRNFVTGHEDIIGPIHHWAKSLIAFNEFMYK